MRTLLLFLLACSTSPYDVAIPIDPAAWEDPDLSAAVKRLTPEEQTLVGSYLLRGALAGRPGRVLTIGEAIESERAHRAEEARRRAESEAAAARVEAERAQARQALYAAVSVGIAEFSALAPNPYRHRYGYEINVTVAFENRTDKPIAAVRGRFLFADSFGEPIKAVSITYEDGIPARGTAAWEASIEVNQFIQEDMRLFGLTPENGRITWEPSDVLFRDGTLLQVP